MGGSERPNNLSYESKIKKSNLRLITVFNEARQFLSRRLVLG
jgi:hypothetical protein